MEIRFINSKNDLDIANPPMNLLKWFKLLLRAARLISRQFCDISCRAVSLYDWIIRRANHQREGVGHVGTGPGA